MSIPATTPMLPSHDQYINLGINLGEDPTATRLRERLDLSNSLSQTHTSKEHTLITTRFTVLESEEKIELVFQRMDDFSNRMNEDFARLNKNLDRLSEMLQGEKQ